MWDPNLPLEERGSCALKSGSSARCDNHPGIRQWRNPERHVQLCTSGFPYSSRVQEQFLGVKKSVRRSLERFDDHPCDSNFYQRRKKTSDRFGVELHQDQEARFHAALQSLQYQKYLTSLVKSIRRSIGRSHWLSSSVRYMWVDRNGRPVSPPSNQYSRSPGYKDKPTYKKVIVSVEDGLSLGLMIRGGAEYGLGIYITGIDEPSAAHLAGLEFGDQILSVNDIDFTNITHDEAVSLLQSLERMSMVVRSEGKVPHSTIPYSPSSAGPSSSGAWFAEGGRSELSRKGSPRKRDHKLDEVSSSSTNPSTAERRLDRKARKHLTESERITLAYYCNEYETGVMSVEDFVPVLLEQLNTPEKYTLMNDIRALVPADDLEKFDELIYRRERQPIKTNDLRPVEIHTEHADGNISPDEEIFRSLSPRSNFRTSTRRRQQQDKHHLTVPNPRAEDMHTPSEDSGVDLANGTVFGHGSRKGSRVSAGSRDSINIEIKSLQRKPSPSRQWRTSPRPTIRRSFDAVSSLRDGNQATRMRRTTFRRHSSGGEGVNPDDRRPRHRSHEDRRWSIGSEMVDAPFVEGHLDAARAVLSRLEAIALTQRRPSPRPPRSPRLSPVHIPLSPTTQQHLQVPHITVRRHRSLPDPHAILARKKQQQMERMHQHRSASVRLPGHRTIPEGDGKFRIIVKKTRPLLGIAIEGGVDTTQPLPRIISIHNSGAAFDAGGLKVGHVILEVDGIKMSRKPHHEVAQLIAHAFYNTDRDQTEFLVMETNKNVESEVRRTSIMIFDKLNMGSG